MRSAVSLALLVAFALPLTAQARPPKDFVGVQDDYLLSADANYWATNLSAMAAVGVGTVRQPFLWRDIEASPGTLDFAAYDALVGNIAAHGVKVLGVVFGPSQSLMKRGPVGSTCPPKSNKQFASFAAALARRYGSRGTYWAAHPEVPRKPITTWQIWNEPNLRPYWCGKPSAKQYVALLKATYPAIKAADRRAEIVTAGIPQSKLGIPLLTYLKQMYRAGAKRVFDTLAIHPYSRTMGELTQRLRAVRRLMDRRGDRAARIWVTELAWSDVGPGSPFRAGPKGQALRIREAFAVVSRLRRAYRLRGAIYVYWRDLAPYPPRYKDFWGLHTGLIRRDGTFKPSYFAFKRAVSGLR